MKCFNILLLLFVFGPINGQVIWINELHYDNSGGDTGEFVEIAGGAGMDVTGYKIVLYNGSNGTSYATINLSGTIPDQSNGFGTLAFSKSGIQNGSPDGLALVDGEDNVLQFLSYEGVFVATNGPAIELVSTNIEVVESSSTPVGFSLQLKDPLDLGGQDPSRGTGYSSFEWNNPSEDSPGQINDGQSFDALALVVETFDLSVESKNIHLRWTTFNELDLRQFFVERSEDGIEFEQITRIESKQNELGSTYSFIDHDLEGDVYYYRLRQINLDGSVDLSSTLIHVFKNEEQAFRLFPSLVTDYLDLEFANSNQKTITIYNQVGQQVYVYTTKERAAKLDLFHLSPGSYFVAIDTKQALISRKIIKR